MSFRIRIHIRTERSAKLRSHVFTDRPAEVTCIDCKSDFRRCTVYQVAKGN